MAEISQNMIYLIWAVAIIVFGLFEAVTAIEDEFRGRGYGDFKTAVGEAVVAELEPVQKKFNELMQDKAYLQECWTNGADFASRLSQRTLDKAMKKIGFLAK